MKTSFYNIFGLLELFLVCLSVLNMIVQINKQWLIWGQIVENVVPEGCLIVSRQIQEIGTKYSLINNL